MQAYSSVAGHWGKHQIKADWHTFTFFLPSLTVSRFTRSCFLPYLLFSHSFCFVLLFLRKQWGLCHFRLHLIYAWISSPVLLGFTTSLSKSLSSLLSSKNFLHISLACTLSLQQVMTEHSDLVAFLTAKDINM